MNTINTMVAIGVWLISGWLSAGQAAGNTDAGLDTALSGCCRRSRL